MLAIGSPTFRSITPVYPLETASLGIPFPGIPDPPDVAAPQTPPGAFRESGRQVAFNLGRKAQAPPSPRQLAQP